MYTYILLLVPCVFHMCDALLFNCRSSNKIGISTNLEIFIAKDESQREPSDEYYDDNSLGLMGQS